MSQSKLTQIKEWLIDYFLIMPLVGIFWVTIWYDKMIQQIKQKYFDYRGIPYYIQHDKFVPQVKRIDRK